jgi:hypothetical protein
MYSAQTFMIVLIPYASYSVVTAIIDTVDESVPAMMTVQLTVVLT